jgi:hypothetical protein
LTLKPVIFPSQPSHLSSSSAPPNFPIQPFQPPLSSCPSSLNFRFSPITRQISLYPYFSNFSHFLSKKFVLSVSFAKP